VLATILFLFLESETFTNVRTLEYDLGHNGKNLLTFFRNALLPYSRYISFFFHPEDGNTSVPRKIIVSAVRSLTSHEVLCTMLPEIHKVNCSSPE